MLTLFSISRDRERLEDYGQILWHTYEYAAEKVATAAWCSLSSFTCISRHYATTRWARHNGNGLTYSYGILKFPVAAFIALTSCLIHRHLLIIYAPPALLLFPAFYRAGHWLSLIAACWHYFHFHFSMAYFSPKADISHYILLLGLIAPQCRVIIVFTMHQPSPQYPAPFSSWHQHWALSAWRARECLMIHLRH